MKIDTKKSSKLFALAVGTLLISHAQATHAQEDHAFDEIQTRAQTAAVSESQSYQATVAKQIITNIQGSDRTINLTNMAENLQAGLDEIAGTGFDTTTDSLVAISTAVNSISTPANVTSLGGSGTDGQQVDVSYIYSDFASLGSGESTDVSQISSQFVAVQGTGFDTTTDSLAAISTAIAQISPESGVATYEQVSALGSITDTSSLYDDFTSLGSSGDVSQIYSDFVSLGSGEGDVSNISSQFVAVQGAGFNSTTDSLTAISSAIGNVTAGGLYTILALLVAQLIGDPVIATIQASTNSQLTEPVTTSSVLSPVTTAVTAYNSAIAAALTAATTAITPATQNYANTVAAQTSLTTAQTAFDGLVTAMNNAAVVPTSDASLAQIQSAIGELQTGLGYLLTQQQPTA